MVVGYALQSTLRLSPTFYTDPSESLIRSSSGIADFTGDDILVIICCKNPGLLKYCIGISR